LGSPFSIWIERQAHGRPAVLALAADVNQQSVPDPKQNHALFPRFNQNRVSDRRLRRRRYGGCGD